MNLSSSCSSSSSIWGVVFEEENEDEAEVHGEPLGLTTVHRDHEPVRIPLNRPSGTFSPIGGEGVG